MPQGQQRRNNARGRIQTPSIPRLDSIWGLVSSTSTQIVLDVPDADPLIPDGNLLNATILELGQAASAMSVSGSQVTLTFAGPLPSPWSLVIPGNDPALRNSSGGFLAAGVLQGNAPVVRTDKTTVTGNANLFAVVSVVNVAAVVELTITPTPPTTWTYTIVIKDYVGAGANFNAPSQPAFGSGAAGEVWFLEWDGSTWTANQLL